MITVNFEGYASYTVDSLYQWDIDRTLEIVGLSLNKSPEIHFTNNIIKGAIVRSTETSGSAYKVKIPNSLLQYPSDILAFVVVDNQTVEEVRIPIIERQRPVDYQIQDSDEEIYSFKALEKMVKETVVNNDTFLASVEASNQALRSSVNSTCNTTVANVNAKCNESVRTVNTKCDDTISEVNETVEDGINRANSKVDSAIDSMTNTVEETTAELSARLDNVIAHNNDTEGNTELIDIRTGADGTVYGSSGEAVRSQVSRINGDLGGISDISNNIIDESKITKNIVINKSGVEVASNNYMVSDFISIKKGDKVTFKSHTQTELIGIFAIQAYDSNKNSIGRVKETYSGDIETYIVGSDSIAFIRFSIGINTTEPMVVFGETLTPYKPYGFKTAIDTVARNEFELFKTSDKLLFTKDDDSVKIHIPTINGYTFYVFKKWINASAFSNVWKLWQYGTSDKSLNTLFASEENIEWEGVVRESDGADFIGGYHGDETVQTISFLIDGNVYDSTIENVENMACDSVKIICFSNIFSCADHTTLLFDRYKVLTFNKDGLNILNRWICKSPVSIGVIYPVMMSINRIVDDKNIVEFGRYDDKFVITPLDPNVEAPDGRCTIRSEYAKCVEMWGDNLYAKCVVKNSVLPSPKKYMFVDRTNQSNIAKMYFGYNDTSIPTSFVSGTQIESEAQFVIEKPNAIN